MSESVAVVARRLERVRAKQDRHAERLNEHDRHLDRNDAAIAATAEKVDALKWRVFLLCAGGGAIGSVLGGAGVAGATKLLGM